MQAITMHMVSYAGRAEMQILVAKDIIPDPKVLAKCFQDSLMEMKEAAKVVAKNWRIWLTHIDNVKNFFPSTIIVI